MKANPKFKENLSPYLDKLKEDLKQYINNKIKEGKQKIIVISTYKFEQTELIQLSNLFPHFTNKEIVNVIDKNIIGGMVIKIGSKIIDLSILSELNKIKNNILIKI